MFCVHRVDVSCCTTLLWHCCDRGNGIRAVVPVLPSQRPVPGHRNRRPRTLKCVQRQIIDYALRARPGSLEVTRAVAPSPTSATRVYLLRAAKFHGRPSPTLCPICRKEQVTLVSWVFGDKLGQVSDRPGQPKRSPASPAPRRSSPCTSSRSARTCSWNHLVQSYVAGLPPRSTRGRRVAKAGHTGRSGRDRLHWSLLCAGRVRHSGN